MKIFSFFDKKQAGRDSTELEDTRARREKNMHANSQGARNSTTLSDQRNAARATELKIDEIESAMTLHLDLDPRLTGATSATAVTTTRKNGGAGSAFQHTKQRKEVSTEILFDDASRGSTIMRGEILPTPVIEEAAILFANNQAALAERLLQKAILEAPSEVHVEHAYLLLFDLYRIGGQQQAFDSLAANYIALFETSPPAWRNSSQPTLAPLQQISAVIHTHHFVMPDIVAGNTQPLIEAIIAFAAERSIVVIDCSQLNHIDFSACGKLLTGLVALAANDKIIEFHQVSHLVAALLNVMGLKEIARIIPRKD